MFLLLFVFVVLGALFVWTSAQVLKIEDQYPPVGQFFGIDGEKTHFVDIDTAVAPTLPPILFVHGASGNLKDQMTAFKRPLEEQARLIFVDRPGHGYSERGLAETPAKQAERFKVLLDELKIEKTILVGHSLGAASVAAFAVLYPDRVQGLVFLAPATHSWDTGVTWYYDVAAFPVIGEIFTETILLPVGQQALHSGSKAVFDPQPVPENYVVDAAIPLMLRPKTFRSNARDVANLNAFVKDFMGRYKEIMAPTVVITGDKDDIVAPSIHSIGLERDIDGAELVVLPGLGHKPDYAATDRVLEAIRAVAK